MDEILGLVDSLEAIILESKKIPFLDKIIIDEKRILNLIDKIRIVIRSEENIVRKAIEHQKREISNPDELILVNENQFEAKVPITLIQEAEKESNKIKDEAKSYADYILANLQLMVTKIQKNLHTIEKGIEDGRETLSSIQVSEKD
ncbi:MAG: hypothetical protein WC860_01935 [Candidatus Margulisiibacteriota bacterium]|jgi:hypothetical protein